MVSVHEINWSAPNKAVKWNLYIHCLVCNTSLMYIQVSLHMSVPQHTYPSNEGCKNYTFPLPFGGCCFLSSCVWVVALSPSLLWGGGAFTSSLLRVVLRCPLGWAAFISSFWSVAAFSPLPPSSWWVGMFLVEETNKKTHTHKR